MSVKRIVIPTLTLIIIASQLMGCAATTQSELTQILERGEAIEIEVAVPLNQEQGEEATLNWEKLALLTSNETLRIAWESTLNITGTGENKNGILYVNAEGKQDANNTLRVALHNREFAKLLEDELSLSELAIAAQNQYADLEVDEELKSVYMGINGYFNLLPDNTPNYSNPDSTLTRLEFMSMVMRAETPVQDIETDQTFATAVGDNELNIYAQEVAEDSYLDLESKSLNNLTATGTITRAEAVYLLMSRYFADELETVDTKSTTFPDAKDGGNIAEEQKIIENATERDYWKSYELTYALQNPDKGLPTSLYKALVLASQKGIITSETRWDEGLTKEEAIDFLVNTLMQEKSIQEFTYSQGIVEGNEAPTDTTISENSAFEAAVQAALNGEGEQLESNMEVTEDTIILDDAYEQDEEDGTPDFTVTPMTATMYAAKNCNVRKGPDADNYDRIGALTHAQEVTVTGKVNEANWYEISLADGTTGYVSATLLSETKPASQSSGNNNSGGTSETSNGGDGTVINPSTGQPAQVGDSWSYQDADGSTHTEIYGGDI